VDDFCRSSCSKQWRFKLSSDRSCKNKNERKIFRLFILAFIARLQENVIVDSIDMMIDS